MYPFIFVRTTPADSPLAGADEPPMLDLLRFHRAPRCNSMGAGRCVSCWLLLEIDGHPTVYFPAKQVKSHRFNHVQPAGLLGDICKKNWREKIHDFWQMISMFAGYIPKYPQFLLVNLVRRLQKRARPKLYPRIFSERSFFFSWFSWAIPNHPKAIFQIHGLYMFTLWLFNIALENHHAIGKPSMSMGHLYHGYVK